MKFILGYILGVITMLTVRFWWPHAERLLRWIVQRLSE